MTIVMLAFMWTMYEGKTTKVVVLVLAALAGIILLTVNRSQALIADTSFGERGTTVLPAPPPR